EPFRESTGADHGRGQGMVGEDHGMTAIELKHVRKRLSTASNQNLASKAAFKFCFRRFGKIRFRPIGKLCFRRVALCRTAIRRRLRFMATLSGSIQYPSAPRCFA